MKTRQCYLKVHHVVNNKESTIEVRNGEMIIPLPGACVTFEKIDITIPFDYHDLMLEVREMQPLRNAIKKPDFQKSFENKRTLRLEKAPRKVRNKYKITERVRYKKGDIKLHHSTNDNCPIEKEIDESVYNFIDSIIKGTLLDDYISDQFLHDKLISLGKYNNVQLLDKELSYSINKTWECWEVRSIPIKCSYPSKNMHSVDYLVLDFDENGNLWDMNFEFMPGLYNGQALRFRYANSDDGLTYQKRHVLVRFLEKYRTAYLTRDISLLDSLYSDGAKIIVGRMITTGVSNREVEFNNCQLARDYVINEYDKETFLSNQQHLFNINSDIHLGFNNCTFSRKNVSQRNIYSITAFQNYTSTIYSDAGHLFLLIDFDGKKPMILIKSWQPNEWREAQLLKLSNYKVTN